MANFQLSVDGGTIFGVSQGEGLPVVFLHAGVTDCRMWQPQLDNLDVDVHAIAYDRRGFGQTVSDDVEFNEIDDLEAVLSHFGVGAAIFLGCSQGGRLAIDFALRHPDQTAGLVLISSSVSGAPSPDLPPEYDPILTALDHADQTDDVDQINLIEAHAWLDGPLQQSGRVDGALRELFLQMNEQALRHADLPQEEDRDEAWELLDQVNAPTLLVCGEHDFAHVIERHSILADELINSADVMIEGCAHLLSMERPDLFNPFLSQFLGSY
ncbi:alpha/beta fold hydrolase [Maritalea sp.]|uniref:alpha/beta fold hydrolase n=1 Tax=Maritalea sp. TaxID=2003361 RepID=UPI003EF75221